MTRRAPVRGVLVALLALSTTLAGCAPDVDRADFDTVRLQTTASSQLYFKNVRSVFYAQRDHAPSGATLYRLKDRPSDTAPDLDAVIANDVLRDRAFVELQPNAAWSALAALSRWALPFGAVSFGFVGAPRASDTPTHVEPAAPSPAFDLPEPGGGHAARRL